MQIGSATSISDWQSRVASQKRLVIVSHLARATASRAICRDPMQPQSASCIRPLVEMSLVTMATHVGLSGRHR
jgi:hypothetical protein